MNLLEKLRAMEGEKSPRPQAPAPPASRVCRHDCLIRPLSEFPGALALRTEALPLMCEVSLPGQPDPCRILYLDTETTGLGNGAGTVAFEVGLGFLTPKGFEIHQLVMRDYPEEADLLRQLADFLPRFDVLCTFNGLSFDVPLLRTRFLMNRLRPDCLDMPHLDLLHIARRVYRLRLQRCNLSHLEEAVLGLPRQDDLPGSQAPERFFRYLKNGDWSEIAPVLRHNAQDIASLCVLLTHMAEAYAAPERLTHAEDLLSMGRALERMRHPEAARRCFHLVPAGRLHAQGQRQLAASWRRSGSRAEAKMVWLEMVRRHEGGAEPLIELAKHCEHVERDVDSALMYTARALELLSEPALVQDETVQKQRNDVQYRYMRLRRRAAALKGRKPDGTQGVAEGQEGLSAAGK